MEGQPTRSPPGVRPVYKGVKSKNAREDGLNIGLTMNEDNSEAVVHVNKVGVSPEPDPEFPEEDPEVQIVIRKDKRGKTTVRINDLVVWPT